MNEKNIELYFKTIAFVIIDNVGQIKYINKGGVEDLFKSTTSLLIEKNIVDIAYWDAISFKKIKIGIKQYLAKKIETKFCELKLVDKNNIIRTLNIKSNRVNNHSSIFDIELFIFENTDNTYVKETECGNNIFKISENEKKKFAMELHDSIGPNLTATKIYIEYFLEKYSNIDELGIIHKMYNSINNCIDSVKLLVKDLNPIGINYSGLNNALKDYIDLVNNIGKIKISYNYECDCLNNSFIEINIYRIITESINNTIKYAQADKIKISIQKYEDKCVRVFYLDNGIGIKNYNLALLKGNGLSNIKQRVVMMNAKIDFINKSNSGFSFIIDIPILF